MVHTLKVIWTSDSNETEIRRLTVHDDIISRFYLLAEKIMKLFPHLTGKSFQLGWKDSEGDYIVMSSDEELAQAVANATENGLIKVYVTMKAAQSDRKLPKSSVVHPHVVCDGCNGSVSGYRYKCLECLDYDLCESCQVEDKHPGHDMLKITSPVGQSHNWMFPGWRRMYRSMFGQRPFGGPCGGRRRFGFEPKHGEEADDKEKQESGQKNPHAEFLRNIGKSVAFFLDPLGIDVDVMVSDGETDSTNCSGGKKGAETQTKVEEREPKNMADEKTESVKDDKSETASLCSEPKEEQIANGTASQNEDCSSEVSVQGARPKNYGLFQRQACSWDGKEMGKEENGDAKAESKDSRESSPENFNTHDDWTVVNSVPNLKDDKIGGDVETAVADMKVSYPEIPEEKMPSLGCEQKEDVTSESAKLIANALSKMCAMGFTNEGGWLIRLLETKNGNINEVLDALYPNRH